MPKAQELSLFGGALNANGINGVTEAWGFSYLHPIADESAISLTWQNEGPLRDNHRDGLSLQYWKIMQLPNSKVVLGVGLGPYVFFNTTGGGYLDQHDIGMMLSIASTKYFSNVLFFQLRINQITANNSFNSTAIMAGIGYDFGGAASFDATSQEANVVMNYDNEITVLAGRSVINNIGKPGDRSYSFEYRHVFDKYADLTMSFINEGHTTPSTRAGAALQGWLRADLLDRKLSFAIGLGPYFAIVQRTPEGFGQDVSVLLSMSAAWNISRQWNVRATWHRVATSYDRDSDVYLGGIGYRF